MHDTYGHTPHRNPLITQDEPEVLKQFKNWNQETSKDTFEVQRLCYEVFIVSANGKKLYEMMQDKYLLPAKFSPSDPNANQLSMYWEGFRAAIRGLKDNALIHMKRSSTSNGL
jgi:hypothetical protein